MQTFLLTNVYLTLILLMWRIWWVPNHASRWQMVFNSAFKGLTHMNIKFAYGKTVTGYPPVKWASDCINTFPANVESMVSS